MPSDATAKRVTVGRHGVITLEGARRRAALIVARIKAGEDPVPELMAVKLADLSTAALRHEEELDEHIVAALGVMVRGCHLRFGTSTSISSHIGRCWQSRGLAIVIRIASAYPL